MLKHLTRGKGWCTIVKHLKQNDMKMQVNNNDRFADFLSQDGTNFTRTDQGLLLEVDDSQHFYDVVFSFAWDSARVEFEEKPDSFWLPVVYAELLERAIKTTCKNTGLLNTSIKFSERTNPDNENEMIHVTVEPTKLTFLFNVFSEYGKMVRDKAM